MNQSDHPVLARFQSHAARHPDRLAIRSMRGAWSYRQLDDFAGRMAAVLNGAGEGGRVALLFGQELEMIAGILGVLRAGSSFVPLDPRWPVPRLNFVLENSCPFAVLIGMPYVSLIEALPLKWSSYFPEVGCVCAVPRKFPVIKNSEGLSYILYTSGSTGVPKGVMQTGANLLRHIDNYTASLNIESSDRLSMFSSCSSDAGMMDIFGALLNGAGLFFFDPFSDGFRGAADWVASNGITIYHSTPSLYRMFQRGWNADLIQQLRAFVLGGEEASPRDVEAFQAKAQADAVLINGYGPTECTLAMRQIIHRDTRIEGRLSLGRAVPGVTVHILDDTGEIVLESPQLALGYWRMPELTSQVFETGPHGERRYRTGDYARVRSDGLLEFAGRGSTRAKVNGYLVEVAEVEAALLELPGVLQSAVTPVERSGYTRLIAHIVPAEGASVQASSFRATLEQRLPPYMVPDVYKAYTNLPLTATGKIDRRQLAVSHGIPGSATITEEAVRDLWIAILRRDISLDDDFFASGGDSLTAIHLLLAVEDTFGVEPSIDGLLENPAIRSFTAFLKRMKLAAPSTVPMSQPYGNENIPISFAQRRYWMRLSGGEAQQSFQVAHCYHIDSEVDVERLHTGLESVMQRHSIMRSGFRLNGSEPAMFIHEAVPCPFSVLDSRSADEGQITRICQEEAARPFDLAVPPLCRFSFLTIAPRTHRLVTVFHHLITDGWSRTIFERDLNALYRFGESEGLHADQHLLSYQEYVSWEQGSFLPSDERRRQLSFWRTQLLDAPLEPCLVPADVSGTPGSSSSSTELMLDAEIVAGLRCLAASEKCSLFAVLLAIFKVTLFTYSGQLSITVTTDSANRRNARWRLLHGLLANVLVLRTAIPENGYFRTVLTRTNAVLRGAMAHEDLAFADLMEELFPGQLERYEEMFPVAVLFERASQEINEGLLRNRVELECRTASRPLLVTFRVAPGALSVVATYRRNRFTPGRIDELLQRFETLASYIGRDPGGRIYDLIQLVEARA